TAIDVLHVFGRTRAGTPKVYYYRKLVDAAYWTAWERVELDINSDHLIPLIWNRRLHLFWPIFTEENQVTNQTQTLNPTRDQDIALGPPPKQWKIQIAWSERKHD